MFKRIKKLIAFHGFLGFLSRGPTVLYKRIQRFFTSSFNHKANHEQVNSSSFDSRWGIDTDGTYFPEKSGVSGFNWKYGGRYQGCDATTLFHVLEELSIDYRTFQFVDLGCGKGRALIVAAHFPFQKIVGVEYSNQLFQVANNNLALIAKDLQQCNEIDIICGDASEFQLPDSSLIIFMYNPFGRHVMDRVFQNVLASHIQNPRRIIVVYFNAIFKDIWKRAAFMTEVKSTKSYTIFDTQSPAN